MNYVMWTVQTYAKSKEDFIYRVTSEVLCAFIAILLTSGYVSITKRHTNCVISNFLAGNLFEETMKYSHLANNSN